MRKQQSRRRDTSHRGEQGRERTSGVSGAACTAAHTDGQEAAKGGRVSRVLVRRVYMQRSHSVNVGSMLRETSLTRGERLLLEKNLISWPFYALQQYFNIFFFFFFVWA